MRCEKGVDELLAPDHIVKFDLDGDGAAERWPWLQPTTALLVWDPAGKGKITSGRQLFGSATWWMLFNDGYQALASLDDTGDGLITDGELDGIAAWFDKDSDGVSDEGEVVSLGQLGIRALSVNSDGSDKGMLTCSNGVMLEDGTTLPSYDWVTTPAEPAQGLPLRLHK